MNAKSNTPAPTLPALTWRDVSRSEHWIMQEDRSHRVLCVRRTGTPIASLEAVEIDMRALADHAAAIQRDSWRLLIDMREAPLRTDPEFEERIRPFQMKFTVGFKRTATLVRTAVGKLQIARSLREAKSTAGAVFTTETEAMAWLLA